MLLRKACRRWCTEVSWVLGRREFMHKGDTYTEYTMAEGDPYYGTLKRNGEQVSMYAVDLPFDPSAVDPNVQITPTGFIWKPTQTAWTRAEAGGHIYFYNGRQSIYMNKSEDPAAVYARQVEEQEAAAKKQQEEEAEQQRLAEEAKRVEEERLEAERKRKEEEEEMKRKEAEEIKRQKEEQRKKEEEERLEEEKKRQEEERLKKEEEERLKREEEERLAAEKEREEIEAKSAVEIEDVAVEIPTEEVTPEQEPELEAVPEVEPEAVPETEPEVVPETEPEAVPETEPEAVPEATETEENTDEQYKAAIDRARELMPVHPVATETPPLASLQHLENHISAPLPPMNTFLMNEGGEVKIRVETGSAEDYAYHLEGLRGVMYQQAAVHLYRRFKALEEDDATRGALAEKINTLSHQARASAELGMSSADKSDSLNRRFMSLPFSPLQGTPELFLPTDSRDAITRYVFNMISLSKALDDSAAIKEILGSEQSLSAVVLESKRELLAAKRKAKHGLWDRDETTASLSKLKMLYHYAAETHNGYLFWNGLRAKHETMDIQSDEGCALLAQAIEQRWGSVQEFKDEFKLHCKSLLGSGHVWLAYEAPAVYRVKGDIKRFDPEAEENTEKQEEVLALASGEEGETSVVQHEEAAQEEEEVTITDQILENLLVRSDTKEVQHHCLKIVTTLCSDSPLAQGFKPLFGISVTALANESSRDRSEDEKREALEWGIVHGDIGNYVDRYFDCVDWRKAEYQLRLCFPEMLVTGKGMQEASLCLMQSGGDVLNSVWVEKMAVDVSKPAHLTESLKRPVREIKKTCGAPLVSSYFDEVSKRIKEKLRQKHKAADRPSSRAYTERRPPQRRVNRPPTRQPQIATPPNAPPKASGGISNIPPTPK
eukprot:TRINITY_DN825_c1_g1_i1.p1 TRINITY_DN825_c1_g1~~TRINITY_DN825_c1_g1_i1.p1  ORF type:complete len:888 (+),score=300.69 TRINITY_DN825_c1_g1_i1:44-2707(+)